MSVTISNQTSFAILESHLEKSAPRTSFHILCFFRQISYILTEHIERPVCVEKELGHSISIYIKDSFLRSKH